VLNRTLRGCTLITMRTSSSAAPSFDAAAQLEMAPTRVGPEHNCQVTPVAFVAVNIHDHDDTDAVLASLRFEKYDASTTHRSSEAFDAPTVRAVRSS
jgi:hypothetical protein